MLKIRPATLFLLSAFYCLAVGPNDLHAATADSRPGFRKVMVVVFENTSYSRALSQPFFSALAKQGALLTNFHGIAHPSQPNYLAMIGGETFGVTSDAVVDVEGQNITDLLDLKGMSWKVYAEAYPGSCYLGAAKKPYVRKHVAFLSLKGIQNRPQKCAKIVNSDALKTDLQAGLLPDYSFFVPDMNHDGHDTSAAFADHWASETFGPLLKDPHFMEGLLLVLTFDEDDGVTLENHIYTVLLGDSVKAGATSGLRYDHYSLLRTVEDTWGLGTLKKNDLQATAISGVWK